MPRKFDPEDVLSLRLMANLATVAVGSEPRNAPMWFIWEDGVIWLLGSSDSSSVGRIDADPRCAIEIVKFENTSGILLHLGLRGRATIEPISPPRFRQLLKKYLGQEENWNSWFGEN